MLLSSLLARTSSEPGASFSTARHVASAGTYDQPPRVFANDSHAISRGDREETQRELEVIKEQILKLKQQVLLLNARENRDMPRPETSLLPSAPSTPLPVASSLSRAQRTREAIEKRSERARAILSSHKLPVLTRHSSAPNLAILVQESSSACSSTDYTHDLSDSNFDDEIPDCPRHAQNYFVRGIVGDQMKQRIAAKLNLLEQALQQYQSTQDERTSSGDRTEMQGDMAVWRAICRKHEAPDNSKPTVLVETRPLITKTVVRRPRRPSIISFEEKMKADEKKTKDRSTALPLPLTQAALNEAYKQLTPGAENSIKSVIQWWRTNKISSNDVLATVKSFTGSSAVLQKIFVTATSDPADPLDGLSVMASIEGEVASDQQMHELSQLMRI